MFSTIALDLQSSSFTHLDTSPYNVAVPTGFEPANADLKDRGLYQFAYGTRLARGLRFELRSTVLETVMLAITLSPHLLVAAAGFEPA